MSLKEKELCKKYNIVKPVQTMSQSIEMYRARMSIYKEQIALAEIEEEQDPVRKKKLKFMFYKLGISNFEGV